VVLCGYYGFGNAGDELILAGMLGELRSLRPGLAVTVISGDPASTRESHGVDAVHWQDVPAIAARVDKADLVLVGGGGLFQEYSGIDRDSLFTDRHYAITFYAEPAILGALHARPVMLYAIGVGPLVSEHGRRVVRAACDAAQVITLRDEESARLVASLGVDPARLRVTADPVFALPVGGGERTQEGLARTLPPGETPLVGVALRHWDVGVASYFWEKEVAAGLDAFLETHEARLLFVPFQHLARASENDAAVAERVRSLLRHPERASVLPSGGDPIALGAILGRCDLVVGMRLHAMILAATAGVPAVALSYDPKVELVMRQLDAERFVVPLADIDARTLVLKMEQALDEGAIRRGDLGERVGRLAELARSNAVAAIDLLDGGVEARTLSPALAEVVARSVTSRFEVEAALRGEVGALRGEMAGLSEEKRRAEIAAAERERAELSARDGKLAQANTTIEERDAELRRVRGDLEARSAELQQLRGDLEARRAELQQVRADLTAHSTKLRQSQTDLAARSAELEEVRDDLSKEAEELEQALDELSRQDEALERSRVEVSQLGSRVTSLDGELLRIHQSRLWKLATRYWRLLEAIGRLPGSKG
jgi:polysaccharide pyruvyl transferase CsaB